MKPLLERGGSPLEKHLLRHARELGPGKGAMQRTLVAVGAAAAATGASATGSAAAAAIGGRGLAAWVVARALAFKWYALGAVVAGWVVSEVAAPGDPPRETSHVVPIASVSATPAPAAPSVASVASAEPEPAPEAPPRVDAPPRREAPRVASGAPSAVREPGSELAAEIALLDEARDALAASNPGRALARLDEHDRMPGRRLAPEAAYIRIEALRARGDDAGARAAARRFLAANPASPHTKRVRALLESLEASNP